MNTTAALNKRMMGKGSSGYAVIRCVFLLPLILAASGCKIRVEVPEGGHVESTSGVFSCESGQTCDVDIVDSLFDETFRAIPEAGYYFRKWEAGERSVCGSTYEPCRVRPAAFAESPTLAETLAKLLKSDVVYTLRPQFVWGECAPSSVTEWDSRREREVRSEGRKCTVPDRTDPVYQGVVRSYVNDELVSSVGYDQDHREGESRSWGYSEYRKYYLQEIIWYSNSGHDGTRIQYDYQSRVEFIYQWKNEALDGKSISNDYTWADAWKYLRVYDPNAGVKISTDNYVNGKLDGRSTIHYPNGAWEYTDWVNGVQHGIHEFGTREIFMVSDWCYPRRYVYTVVNGEITDGAVYSLDTCDAEGNEPIDEPVQRLFETWTCSYVDGVLDEEQCFRHKVSWRGPWLD